MYKVYADLNLKAPTGLQSTLPSCCHRFQFLFVLCLRSRARSRSAGSRVGHLKFEIAAFHKPALRSGSQFHQRTNSTDDAHTTTHTLQHLLPTTRSPSMPHSDLTPVVTPTKPAAAAFSEAKEHTPEKLDATARDMQALKLNTLEPGTTTLTEAGAYRLARATRCRHASARPTSRFEFRRSAAGRGNGRSATRDMGSR
jgi:hypothetical protein